MEVAVNSYIKVVEMAPLHLEARLSLSTLQQQLGNPDGALQALQPMYDPETLAQDSTAAQQVDPTAPIRKLTCVYAVCRFHAGVIFSIQCLCFLCRNLNSCYTAPFCCVPKAGWMTTWTLC